MNGNRSPDNDPGKSNKGFAGFSSLVTDNVDQVIANAFLVKAEKKSEATPASDPKPIASPPPTPPSRNQETKGGSSPPTPPTRPQQGTPKQNQQSVGAPSQPELLSDWSVSSRWKYFLWFIGIMSILSFYISTYKSDRPQQHQQQQQETRTVSPPTPTTTEPLTAEFIQEFMRKEAAATVFAIQMELNALGYDVGSADGIPGKKTTTAIKKFQRDQGILIDGIADSFLLDRLKEVVSKKENKKEVSNSPIAQSLTQTSSRQSAWERPATAPNGNPWPTSAAYIKGYKRLHADGLSTVTVDNSQNASDVFVKLTSLDGTQAYHVRQFFIPARGKFTLNKVTAGNYDIRYRDLGDGGLARSESFRLSEEQTSDGMRYSIFTMTLYKVTNGNMETFVLSEAEF